LDARVQEIIQTAKENNILVVFALSRKKIGNAFGKTLRMSAVGICNIDGMLSFRKSTIKKLLSTK
jgi:ribosomal protein L7Ae-like RNA K-turn-binding protein